MNGDLDWFTSDDEAWLQSRVKAVLPPNPPHCLRRSDAGEGLGGGGGADAAMRVVRIREAVRSGRRGLWVNERHRGSRATHQIQPRAVYG